MSDLFGGHTPGKPFTDIRKVRPSSAEEKATLLLTLGGLINKCPASVQNGSVNAVRAWKEDRTKAAKVAGNSRASANEITMAISNMRRYF